MSEADLQREILRMAKRYGILAHHCNDARRCMGETGLPDLLLVGKRGILYRELKAEGGDLSTAQRIYGYRITAAGGDHAVWRPDDLASGSIEWVLSGL